MARYIDADKLEEILEAKADTLIEGKEAFLQVAKWLKLLPAADVVPREEVEVWKQERFNIFQQIELYEMTRQKVAREIFAEIESETHSALDSNYKAIREHNAKHFPNTDALLLERVYGKIDALRGIDGLVEELKKKYTEGQK